MDYRSHHGSYNGSNSYLDDMLLDQKYPIFRKIIEKVSYQKKITDYLSA